MTSPPQPESGQDCFPVKDCNDSLPIITFVGAGTSSFPDDEKPIELFFDINGFAWLRVNEYAWHPSDGIRPFYARIYKCTTVFDCDSLRTAAATGVELPAVDWTLVCSRQYTGWDVEFSCCDPTCFPLFTAADVSGRLYKNYGDCCELPRDECNESKPCAPPDGGYEPVSCEACDVGAGKLAPGSMLLMIPEILDPEWAQIAGTWELPFLDCPAIGIGFSGYWARYFLRVEGGTTWDYAHLRFGVSNLGTDPVFSTTARVHVSFFYESSHSSYCNTGFDATLPQYCTEIDRSLGITYCSLSPGPVFITVQVTAP